MDIEPDIRSEIKIRLKQLSRSEIKNKVTIASEK